MSQGFETRPTYWAVKSGFEGPKIYNSWEGAQPNIEGFQGAWFKSFRTLELARRWLDEADPALALVEPRRIATPQATSSPSRPFKRSPSMEEPFPGPPRKREPSSTPAPIIPSYVKRETTPTPGPMVIDLSSSPETSPQVKRETYAPTTPHRAHTMPEAGSSKSLFIDLTDSPPERKPFDVYTPTAPRIAPPNFGQTSTPSGLRSPLRPPSASRMDKIMAGLAAMDDHLETGDSDGSGPSAVDGTPGLAPINLKPTGPIVLSEEQQGILNAVLQGQSLFFTGSAGTGKSVLLREIIKQLRDRDIQVAVTASTGIASINVGGSTIHSFAGCGLAKGSKEELGKSVVGGSAARRWRSTRVLVIDEISMIDGNMFDKFEYIARCARNSTAPFGGLQLIICGDFYQLPPVPDQLDGRSLPTLFAFEADTWDACVPRIITLTQVFRQKERSFIDMLDGMRLGKLSSPAIKTFYNLSREVKYDDGLLPTELYPTRKEAENANFLRLKSLPEPEKTFRAHDYPGYDAKGELISAREMVKLLDRVMAPESLTLRVGTQVMLIQNLVQGRLANGSIGRVTAFMTRKEANEKMIMIANVEQNTRGNLTTQHALPPRVGTPIDIDTQWPVVKFENGDEALCPPLPFTVVNVFGRPEATRDQVPLLMGWAMTIHKSQGQTLGRVKVNLGRIFEKGQAYVAISRATSLETLQVLNFQPVKVQAHPKVIEFHKRLGTAASLMQAQSIVIPPVPAMPPVKQESGQVKLEDYHDPRLEDEDWITGDE